jgi:hypothetical protein
VTGGNEKDRELERALAGWRYLVMVAGLGFALTGQFQTYKGLIDQHMDEVTASSAPRSVIK